MTHTNQSSSLYSEAFESENKSDSKAFLFSSDRAKAKRRIALVATVAWTIWNYRQSLMVWLEAAGYEVLVIACEDEASDKFCGRKNITFYSLGKFNRASISPWSNFSFFARLFEQLSKAKPDAVLFFTLRPNILGNFASAFLNIPAVSTIEGLGITGSPHARWQKSLTRIFYRLAFRRVHKVLFLNNDDLREFIGKHILPEPKALVVPGPGIDPVCFSPAQRQTKLEVCTFLYSGRLLVQKGIREFIAAAAIIRSRGIQARFWVLGAVDPGNPDSIPEKEILTAHQNGIVHYRGFLEDVRPVVAASDVVVLPSWYREGVPRAILEGMAMAKPVIVADTIGCRDTVTQGLNGYLVSPQNPAALADAMCKLLALEPEKRLEMGLASRKKAELEFSDQQVLPVYLAILEELFTDKMVAR